MAATVRDVMGTVAIAVTMDATFTQLVETMRRYGVGAVTVVDADRRPIGVVSEDDLLLKEIEAGGRPFGHLSRAERRKVTGTTAAELMTTPAITVTVGTPIRDAARLMHRNRIKQLPVIEPATGRIVGTVHQGDLLRVFARPAEEISGPAHRRRLLLRRKGRGPGQSPGEHPPAPACPPFLGPGLWRRSDTPNGRPVRRGGGVPTGGRRGPGGRGGPDGDLFGVARAAPEPRRAGGGRRPEGPPLKP